MLPNGDVLVAETNGPPRPENNKGIRGWFFKRFQKKAGGAVPSANQITLLRDQNGDGIAETTEGGPRFVPFALPGERVRVYFVNAGPNEFSSFHPIGEIWDNVYESGNPANKLTGVQTYVVGPGSAATFDVVVESAGAYPLVTHSLTGALRGAIAVLLASPDAKPSTNLMPMVPWELPAKTK